MGSRTSSRPRPAMQSRTPPDAAGLRAVREVANASLGARSPGATCSIPTAWSWFPGTAKTPSGACEASRARPEPARKFVALSAIRVAGEGDRGPAARASRARRHGGSRRAGCRSPACRSVSNAIRSPSSCRREIPDVDAGASHLQPARLHQSRVCRRRGDRPIRRRAAERLLSIHAGSGCNARADPASWTSACPTPRDGSHLAQCRRRRPHSYHRITRTNRISWPKPSQRPTDRPRRSCRAAPCAPCSGASTGLVSLDASRRVAPRRRRRAAQHRYRPPRARRGARRRRRRPRHGPLDHRRGRARAWASSPPRSTTSTWPAAAARSPASPSRRSTSARASYDTGRALFAAARDLKVGALIFEIARSEIGYTDQRPAEYVAVLTAAAIKEGWTGPLFIQGDHFQVNAKKYAADPEPEVRAVRDLIREAIHAGFYNIDVDTSTLVDLSQGRLDEQQELNYQPLRRAHRLHPRATSRRASPSPSAARSARSAPRTPRRRSCAPTWTATSASWSACSAKRGSDARGALQDLRPVRHLARRRRAARRLDRRGGDRLRDAADPLRHRPRRVRPRRRGAARRLHAARSPPSAASRRSRRPRSTSPPASRTSSSTTLRSPASSASGCTSTAAPSFPDERKPTDTEEQFIYKTRKKALGAFKRELWELPEANRAEIREGAAGAVRLPLPQLGRGGHAGHGRAAT